MAYGSQWSPQQLLEFNSQRLSADNIPLLIAMSSSNATAGPSTPASLPVAVIHDAASSSTDSPIDPFNAFFGYTLSQTSTRESQHDRPLSSSSFESELPPAYVEPPAYEMSQTEPATLAMFLFKFGFCTFIRYIYLYL